MECAANVCGRDAVRADTLALERSSFDAPSCAWRALRAPIQTNSHDTWQTGKTDFVELCVDVRATCLPRPRARCLILDTYARFEDQPTAIYRPLKHAKEIMRHPLVCACSCAAPMSCAGEPQCVCRPVETCDLSTATDVVGNSHANCWSTPCCADECSRLECLRFEHWVERGRQQAAATIVTNEALQCETTQCFNTQTSMFCKYWLLCMQPADEQHMERRKGPRKKTTSLPSTPWISSCRDSHPQTGSS